MHVRKHKATRSKATLISNAGRMKWLVFVGIPVLKVRDVGIDLHWVRLCKFFAQQGEDTLVVSMFPKRRIIWTFAWRVINIGIVLAQDFPGFE